MNANTVMPKTVSELFPSKYLRSDDLGDKAWTLTVEQVTFEQMHDSISKEDTVKAVVHFAGAQRGLVLNKTQALAMADLAKSEEFAKWPGLRVMLRTGRQSGKQTIVVSAPPAEK